MSVEQRDGEPGHRLWRRVGLCRRGTGRTCRERGGDRRDTKPVLPHLPELPGASDCTLPCEKANILIAFLRPQLQVPGCCIQSGSQCRRLAPDPPSTCLSTFRSLFGEACGKMSSRYNRFAWGGQVFFFPPVYRSLMKQQLQRVSRG